MSVHMAKVYIGVDPLRVRVTSQHDVVADVVVVQSLERAILVRHVPIPGVAVEWVLLGAKPGGHVDA